MKKQSIKHLGLVIVCLLFAGAVQAQSKLDNLFKKLGENDKMTTVFISKDMMNNMANMAQPNADSTDRKDIKKLTDELGHMRVISSENLSNEEQDNYNKMILAVLNDGYKDIMTVSTKEHGKQTDVRMCVKPSDKDNISEFVMYVREGEKLSLISIVGNIENSKLMELSKLSNLKGMIKESVVH